MTDPRAIRRGRPDLVRPFLMTGGRTRPVDESLAIEAMVVSVVDVRDSQLRFEAADIVQLCVQPVSIAEIAAHLRIPLGVARVLVADLDASGHVDVREPSPSVAEDVTVIERLIERVRAL
ncbi:MAG: DUF742 domain-containing protein [Actinomycetota bacterium]